MRLSVFHKLTPGAEAPVSKHHSSSGRFPVPDKITLDLTCELDDEDDNCSELYSDIDEYETIIGHSPPKTRKHYPKLQRPQQMQIERDDDDEEELDNNPLRLYSQYFQVQAPALDELLESYSKHRDPSRNKVLVPSSEAAFAACNEIASISTAKTEKKKHFQPSLRFFPKMNQKRNINRRMTGAQSVCPSDTQSKKSVFSMVSLPAFLSKRIVPRKKKQQSPQPLKTKKQHNELYRSLASFDEEDDHHPTPKSTTARHGTHGKGMAKNPDETDNMSAFSLASSITNDFGDAQSTDQLHKSPQKRFWNRRSKHPHHCHHQSGAFPTLLFHDMQDTKPTVAIAEPMPDIYEPAIPIARKHRRDQLHSKNSSSVVHGDTKRMSEDSHRRSGPIESLCDHHWTAPQRETTLRATHQSNSGLIQPPSSPKQRVVSKNSVLVRDQKTSLSSVLVVNPRDLQRISDATSKKETDKASTSSSLSSISSHSSSSSNSKESEGSPSSVSQFRDDYGVYHQKKQSIAAPRFSAVSPPSIVAKPVVSIQEPSGYSSPLPLLTLSHVEPTTKTVCPSRRLTQPPQSYSVQKPLSSPTLISAVGPTPLKGEDISSSISYSIPSRLRVSVRTASILLIKPELKIFEIVSVPVTRQTNVRNVLDYVKQAAVDPRLAELSYVGLCIDQEEVSKDQQLIVAKMPIDLQTTKNSAPPQDGISRMVTSECDSREGEEHAKREMERQLWVAIPNGSTARDCQSIRRLLWRNPKLQSWWKKQHDASAPFAQ
jgi:hypothetical protein